MTVLAIVVRWTRIMLIYTSSGDVNKGANEGLSRYELLLVLIGKKVS